MNRELVSDKVSPRAPVDRAIQPHGVNDHQKHTRTPYRHTRTIPEGRPPTYYAKNQRRRSLLAVHRKANLTKTRASALDIPYNDRTLQSFRGTMGEQECPV